MKREWWRTKVLETLKEVIAFNKIECAGWLDSSCDDGPGMISILFLQGCMKIVSDVKITRSGNTDEEHGLKSMCWWSTSRAGAAIVKLRFWEENH